MRGVTYVFISHGGYGFLAKISLLQQYYASEIEYINVGEFKVSNKTIEVLKVAKKRMERFQQVLINEGHVLYALFQVDTVIEKVISKNVQKELLSITSESRDLTVDLKDLILFIIILILMLEELSFLILKSWHVLLRMNLVNVG